MTLDIQQAMRNTRRWAILQAINSARPNSLSDTVILSLVQATVQATKLELHSDLDYLAERQLVTVSGRDQMHWHARLTKTGIDLTEFTIDCEPGIARPDQGPPTDVKTTNGIRRWLILQTLLNAQPIGFSESSILGTVNVTLPTTKLQLQKELDYLSEAELVKITERHSSNWHAKLTRTGIETAEYTIAEQVGITRPKQYW